MLPILEPGDRVLDLCSGTGDVAHAIRRAARQGVEVFGSDFCEAMLRRAPVKAAPSTRRPHFLVSDALRLPHPAAAFRAVTAAFGLRNVEDPSAALREIARVLVPGGRLLVLEFSRPPAGVFATLYRIYVFRILPFLGGALSGHRGPYSYLPSSVWSWPGPAEVRATMEECGLRVLEQRPFLRGAVVLHVAQRGG